MNDTRELTFGLRMSPIPGENKKLDGLPHEGGDCPRKAAVALASDLVMSPSLSPALLPSLPTPSTHCTQGGGHC